MVAEEGNYQVLASAPQAEGAEVRRNPALPSACSTHNNGWAQPSCLVSPGFLVYRCPGTGLPAGVASPPGPHKSMREVSAMDRPSRFVRTASCWCLRIQPVRSSCSGRRKKPVESVNIRAEGRQCSDYLQIVVASPRSSLSNSSAQRQTLRRGTIRVVFTSSHNTRQRWVSTALLDKFANLPTLCYFFQHACCVSASLTERPEMF